MQTVADHVVTLAEFLAADPDFTMPDLSAHTIDAQPHCHEASGAKVTKVSGYCGLAGNHGMIDGHYEYCFAARAEADAKLVLSDEWAEVA